MASTTIAGLDSLFTSGGIVHRIVDSTSLVGYNRVQVANKIDNRDDIQAELFWSIREGWRVVAR